MSKLCNMSGLRSAAQLTHATIGVIFDREFGVKQACSRSDSAGLKAGAHRCTHRSARKGFWQNVAGARKMLIGACVAVAGATAAASLAAAQGAVNPDEARKKLDADKSRLEASQRRSKELQADMDKLAAERQRINERLVDTARLIQQSEGQLNLIESRLGDLEAQEKQVRGSLAQRQGSISALLAAMQRMGRNPPPVMVTRREDALSMVRSAMLLAAAFPELRGQALGLAEQLNDLVRVMTGIRTEGDKLRVRDHPAERGAHAPRFPAGNQAPIALRPPAGTRECTQGRSRHSQERVGPQRPDFQARQGGRRQDRPRHV